MSLFDDAVEFLDKYIVDEVWIIAILIILIAGLVLLWLIDWPNFKVKESFHIMRHMNREKKGISTMGSFFVALSSRMGAGNIIGVSIAIIIGGPGAILWMWVFSLFGAILCFAECTLGQIFKEKKSDGLFRGGPAYYTEKGLHNRKIALLFSVLLFVLGFVLAGTQACNMNESIRRSIDFLPAEFVGLLIVAAAGFIIFYGLKKITKALTFMVPIFACIWIFATLITIIMHADRIPGAFAAILSNGLGLESVGGASLGLLIITGFKRGAFCSEGGTGQISSVSSSAEDGHPCVQGYMQSLGVYVDIFCICTMSALLLLSCGVAIPTDVGQAIPFIIDSLETGFLGDFGKPFFSIILSMITFSAIFGDYALSESNGKYLFDGKKNHVIYMNIGFLACVYILSITKISVIWALADLITAVIVVLNIYIIFKLYKYVSKATKDYHEQRRSGVVNPTFDSDKVLVGLETSEITEWGSEPKAL